MKITRHTEREGRPGPGDYFTGRVHIEPIYQPSGPERAGVLKVSFAAGARTAWHTHPLGQLLIVTEGEGWVQKAGDAKEVIHPGDSVWIPAGERHWHGATATSPMTHIAIQEALDGRAADWQEQVTDEDYAAG